MVQYSDNFAAPLLNELLWQMKTTPNKTQGSNKQKKVVNKDKGPVQKDHQEALQLKDNSFEENRKKLLEETQEYMYSQSSKFSSVSRTLILGIIGTIWVITYSEGKMFFPNFCLALSLVCGLLFLLTDVFHYFLDSISYHKEEYKLEEYKTQKDLDSEHETKMNHINNRSHGFLIGKFVILMITAIFFAIGLLVKIQM